MAYRLIDHTADVGLEVSGETPGDLFSQAVQALMDLLVEAGPARDLQLRDLEVEGGDWADLWVNFLREILYLFQGEGLLTRALFLDRIAPPRLSGRIGCQVFDGSRHAVRQEIKAVTYHQAEIRETPEGWEGRVIFDV